MNVRFLAVPVVAFLAGLAGGWASRLMTIEKLSETLEKMSDLRHSRTVRATRFELVDEAGKTKAFIGTDSVRDTALVFRDDQKRERAKFGVWYSTYTPKIVARGGDGKERFVFYLSRVDDRPMILLRDNERTRVHLEFFQNDAPSEKDEDWGIRFYDPHKDDEDLAALGMRRDWNDDKMEGFVFAQGKNGQQWREPKP